MIGSKKKGEMVDYVVLSAMFLTVLGFLFRESFTGLLLQGVDDNISMRAVIVRSLLSGQGYHFIPNYWLGFIFNIPNPDFYSSILAITGSVKVVGVFVIALICSGYITFILLKRMNISTYSSFFGAISYTLLPHILTLVYSAHALALESVPMTPGLLLCLSIILDDHTTSSMSKALAGVWGGIFWAWMMIGEPQRGIYGSILAFSWAGFLFFKTESISFASYPFIKSSLIRRKLIYLVLIVVFGVGIFFSTLMFWTQSEFLLMKGSWQFVTEWSFPPSELLDTFAFGYHGLITGSQESPYYGDKLMSNNSDSLGFFMLLFTILAVMFIKQINKKEAYFFAIAGLIALILSFGKYFPGIPFFWLWYHVPGMDKLRVPAKFLSITGLSWSILAAIGLDAVTQIFSDCADKYKKEKELILITLGVSVCVSLLWFFVLLLSHGGDATSIELTIGHQDKALINAALSTRINSVLSMILLFITTFGIFIVASKKPQISLWIPVAIIILAIYNLYTSNRFFIEKSYVDEKLFYKKTPLVEFLQDHLGNEYRASGSLFLPNTTQAPHPTGAVVEQHLYPLNNYDLTYTFPYFDINLFGRIPISRLDDRYDKFFKSIYHSIPNYTSYQSIWEMNKRLWYLGNVKYLLVGEEYQKVFAEELKQDTTFVTNVIGSYNYPVFIYELNEVLPRFSLIHNIKPVYDLYLFDELSKSITNIAKFQLSLEDTGLDWNNRDRKPQQLGVQRKNYNAYEIDVSSEEDNIFYFGDLYDEGWKAKIDGNLVQLHRANGIQQYVYVPKRSQKLEIYYHRVVPGLLLSRIIIVISFIVLILHWINQLRQTVFNKKFLDIESEKVKEEG